MTAQPEWKLLLETDYYAIFTDATGKYTAEMEIREDNGNGSISVYRFPLDRLKREIVEEPNGNVVYVVPFNYEGDWPYPASAYEEWFIADLADVATSVGSTRQALINALCSDDPKVRAFAYLDVAGYHGADNFDSYPRLVPTDEFVSEFTEGYIECALWCGVLGEVDGELQSVSDADESDLTDEAREEMEKDCRDFCAANIADLIRSGQDASESGHDFYLTRNRHGAGFWDRGLGEVGTRLSDASRAHGAQGLMVCDDGTIVTYG